MFFFKRLLIRFLPKPLIKWGGQGLLRLKINKVQKVHKARIIEISKKDRIKIAFFLINVDTWKLHSVYKSFYNSKRFEPIVVICPFISKGNLFLEEELEKSINYCRRMNYNHFVAYDKLNHKVKDVKTLLQPDLVFFTNPNNLTFQELLIDNFLDTLTCYVPYSFRIDTLYDYEFNNKLVNLSWINFYESKVHKELSEKFALNNGRNVIATGFPYLDLYNLQQKVISKNKKIKVRKKIIWAPHWTIKGYQKTGLDWSCFLKYYLLMLELAEEFESEIELILKPHPFLQQTLEQSELWGEKRTLEYFEQWRQRENCEIVYGDYSQLFIESDALIHDSGSFMTEYIVLNKPLAYTVTDDSIENRFNKFGQIVFEGHELIRDGSGIKNFILKVIAEKDDLCDLRKDIIKKTNLIPEYGISERIVNIINENLNGNT